MAGSNVDFSKNSTRAAIGGSGVTVMKWEGEIIGFCNGVTVTWPSAVNTEVAIQPLDAVRPIEIVTARGIGMGTIVLTLTTLYNAQIWDRFSALAGSNDLADIFQAVQDEYYSSSTNKNGLTIERVIYPPINQANGGAKKYTEQFQKCVVTNVADGFAFQNNSMTIDRQMTLAFAKHVKINGGWTNNPKNSGRKLAPDIVGF